MKITPLLRPFGALWGREPVAIQALVIAFVNLLFVFSVIRLSVPQMAATNMFLVALLAFVARAAVTPVASPKDGEGNRLVPVAPWQRVKGEAEPRRQRSE
ncbi:MAG TPA: hypothetical protein VFL27_06440 [Candidatus Dormibacteraeota bacterium]|nr:hypothetical protein [Candidatus Dormibacteraeota bacterium]